MQRLEHQMLRVSAVSKYFQYDRVDLSSLSRSQDLRNVSMCLQLSM